MVGIWVLLLVFEFKQKLSEIYGSLREWKKKKRRRGRKRRPAIGNGPLSS